jgi:AmmeMemoRadiSam system protein A
MDRRDGNRERRTHAGKEAPMNAPLLDRAAQLAALELADEAIRAAVLGKAGPSRDTLARAQDRHHALRQPAGAFVTIYVAGDLRGCLGEIEPQDALAETIVRCASRVPRYDYRFAPVRPEELGELTFKISALSPPQPVSSIEEIQVGTHGLIARHGGCGGVLLPEVPIEHGWDLDEFLQNLWRKAGLAPEVAIRDVKLFTFTSQIVSSASSTVQ